MRITAEKILSAFIQGYENLKKTSSKLQKMLAHIVLSSKTTPSDGLKKFNAKKEEKKFSINPINIQNKPPTLSAQGAAGKVFSYCKSTLEGGVTDEKRRALENFEKIMDKDYIPPEVGKGVYHTLGQAFDKELEHLPKDVQDALNEVKSHLKIPPEPKIYL